MMKLLLKYNLSLCCLVVFLVLTYPALSSCAPSLPASRPNDFALLYSTSTGMTGYGKNINIGTNRGSAHIYGPDGETKVTLILSGTELDTIYQSLRKNHLTSITLGNDRYYDAGGESITVSWDNQSFSVGNGYHRIKDQWQDEWQKIISVIESTLKPHLVKLNREKSLPSL